MTIAVPRAFPLAKAVSVLAVSPAIDDHSTLRAIFTHSHWTLRGVLSLKDALAWLERDPVPVVICRGDLPDGTWLSLVRETKILPCPPRVIVSAESPDDRLWEDAGVNGAYDVLEIPFAARDVYCSVHLAWESWHRQWGEAAGAAAANGKGDSHPPAA